MELNGLSGRQICIEDGVGGRRREEERTKDQGEKNYSFIQAKLAGKGK